jgi:hypothetical protein
MLSRLQLAVRGHKQTRKNIHGVYELQVETRKMTAIRGQGYRPLSGGVKARSGRRKKLTDKVWARLHRVIEAARR